MVLPPGYTDEVYCPKGFCIRYNGKRIVGPKSSTLECYNKITDEIQKISTWGPKLNNSIKDNFIKQGYLEKYCQDSSKSTPEWYTFTSLTLIVIAIILSIIVFVVSLMYFNKNKKSNQ